VIDGGLGSDVLYGEEGGDTFVFTDALGPSNVDFLADFTSARGLGTLDLIALDDAIFTGLQGFPIPISFHEGTAAEHSSHRIIYNKEIGSLLYDPDGVGMQPAVQFATLQPGTIIHQNDFIVI
jgi:Ca2+-binding RTX toxin-like protein